MSLRRDVTYGRNTPPVQHAGLPAVNPATEVRGRTMAYERILWRIAGEYCEHMSVGKSCPTCIDVVDDVLRAIGAVNLRIVPVAGL